MLKIISRSNYKIQSQFARYLLVGGVAFICDYATMVACTELLRLHYLVSATIGFSVGLAVNYVISVRWVFLNRNVSNKVVEFVVFAVIGIVGMGINDATIYLCYRVGVDYRIAKFFATGITLAFNFLARKLLLFQERGDPIA